MRAAHDLEGSTRLASTLEHLSDIDIASPAVYEAGIPHESFRLLRDNAPVHWHEWTDRSRGFWAITRHEDIVAISRDPATYSSAAEHVLLVDLDPDELKARRSLLETDPPEHTRLRRLVSSAFTPGKVAEYEEATREIASGLLDDLIAEGGGDFVEAVSAPLPINVIVRILGIPEEDAPFMLELSDHLVEGTSGAELDPAAYGNTTPLSLLPFGSPASHALFEYGRKIGNERREHPRDDLVTRLVQAEVEGESLTDAEYCNFFQILVFAGNETTRTAISQGLHALIESPDELDRLRADRALIPSAVEEILRWATPIMYFRRTAMEDTEIRGVPIARGDKVVMWYVSGNFDDRVLDDPLRFDVGRGRSEHVTFGGTGPHYCLGAWLARLELKVLLEELLDRDVRFESAGPPARIRSNFVNGLRTLPVRVVTDA
jgi:cholest-4-en-3-one 26-monooxygenase